LRELFVDRENREDLGASAAGCLSRLDPMIVRLERTASDDLRRRTDEPMLFSAGGADFVLRDL